ncbi:MAG: PH domain-containing protein [Pirellulales bacterium]|nr:PH domain-containing protein [Pirellulales bacterium]
MDEPALIDSSSTAAPTTQTAASSADTSPEGDTITDWFGDPQLQSLDPRFVMTERVAGWIFVAVVGAVAFLVLLGWILANWPPGWGMGLVILLLVALLAGFGWYVHAWPPIAYRWCRYRASEEGLEIYRGVFWRSVVNVPRFRIQHTDVRQGPLQRRYGLSKLVVHTAGTEHAMIELDGLCREEALALRDLLRAQEEEDGII